MSSPNQNQGKHKIKEYNDPVFSQRLFERDEELFNGFMSLYHNEQMYENLIDRLFTFYQERSSKLKDLDNVKLKNPGWFHSNDMVSYQIYVEKFAGNLKNIESKLDYLENLKIKMLFMMPVLKSPNGKSDGGFAVSDYHSIQPELGTMNDLEHLFDELHKRKIWGMIDVATNHTSDEHEWAKRAKAGEKEYQDRYYFYDNWLTPNEFEQTMTEIFPETAPGNFTWVPECKKIVLTTFYPYQWDLNYRNPIVFQEIVCNLLFLANKGVDAMFFDSQDYVWKEIGTSCRNLPQSYLITRMIKLILEIVCPGVVICCEYYPKTQDSYQQFVSNIKKQNEVHITSETSWVGHLWRANLTRDVTMLKDFIVNLNKIGCVPLNSVRTHDEINWSFGQVIQEKNYILRHISLLRFLNDYYSGYMPYSQSRGLICYENLVTGEARISGRSASLAGLEIAIEEKNQKKIDNSINRILMLHALSLSIPGVPMIYSGDEIGEINNYSYTQNDETKDDPRFLNRNVFNWEKAKLVETKDSVESKIFNGLRKMIKARGKHIEFSLNSNLEMIDCKDTTVLIFKRYKKNIEEGKTSKKYLLCIINFYEFPRTIHLDIEGEFKDIISGDIFATLTDITLKPYGWYWLSKK